MNKIQFKKIVFLIGFWIFCAIFIICYEASILGFKTEIGATGGEDGYLRPETAQAMFLNYKRGIIHAREKLPFALAQSSKVARNEISPRRGILRLREFTIMELELFFDPANPVCPWYNDVKDTIITLFTEEMMENEVKDPIILTVDDAVNEGLILT